MAFSSVLPFLLHTHSVDCAVHLLLSHSRALLVRGRSQLSTFMKAYTAYARGEGSGTTVRFSPENQHLFLITDNVLQNTTHD